MDSLTQLQDALDQLATRFYCSLRYISTHHDAAPLGTEAKVKDENATVDDPATFASAQTELAQDIIIKSRQIELLILHLPGIGISEDEQQERLRVLEAELKEAERERVESVREKEECLERLDEVIRCVRRV